MITFKKNKEYQTKDNNFLIVRATPQDALPGDTSKNFYIVDLVTRPGKGGAAYSIESKIIDAYELRRLLEVKKRENISWI